MTTTILDAPVATAPLAMKTRYAVNVGEVRSVHLALAGCGGTGSFLALHLARLAWHLRETRRVEFYLTFVDPDVVESKNIGRQNFVPAEIGRPKAEALATRYARAFGLPILFYNQEFSRDSVQTPGFGRRDGSLYLVCGCVDNTAARASIAGLAKLWPGLWWLDAGNHDDSGQVLIGNRHDLKEPEISPLGFCTGLPLPSVLHPELVARPKKKRGRRAASCADDALAGAQSLMINQMVAAWAASYVHRLVMGNLDTFATYFDLHSGSARSEYILKQGEY
jgi:PRTRC genetic system ThiF family protein